MAEISAERYELAIEATRGTAVTPPTHVVFLDGSVSNHSTSTSGQPARGLLSDRGVSKRVRKWGEWDMSGAADANFMPVLGNMAVKGNVTSPTTPVGATDARLWTFPRAMTADNLESATLYFGDPSVQMWQHAYAMVSDDLVVTADASSEELVQVATGGMAQFGAQVASPTAPTAVTPETLIPGLTDLWMDAAVGDIGDTAITGRLVSAEVTVPTGRTYKYLAQGAAGTLGYSNTGRTRSHPTATLQFELLDTAQYDIFEADTEVAMRVRFNAEDDSIETGFNHYVEFDLYGKLTEPEWGELEGSNRTVTFTLEGDYVAGWSTDIIMRVQNAKAAL